MSITETNDDLDFVGSYTITEITGDRRTLVLSGRALPYRPFKLVGSQRAKVTRYPGSPIGTLQFLGASEDDATINGAWKDRFIGEGLNAFANQGTSTTSFGGGSSVSSSTAPAVTLDGAAVSRVRDLAEIVDDIRVKGQVLEVSWLHLRRVGYLRRFTQTWHNAHDLEWEIEFEWIAKDDDPNVQLAITPKTTDISTISEQANALASKLDDASVPQVEQSFSVTKTITGFVRAIQGRAQAIEDTLLNYVSGATSSADSVRAASSMLQETIDQASSTIDYVASVPARSTLIAGSSLSTIAQVTAGQAIAAAASLRRTTDAANDTRRTSARNLRSLINSVNPDLVTSVYAIDGQDLREISLTYYGTQDGWHFLAEYNNLGSSLLHAGQLVLVPARWSGEVTS